jgi:hypothetical protein
MIIIFPFLLNKTVGIFLHVRASWNADEPAPEFMDEGPDTLKIFLWMKKINFRREFSIEGFVSTGSSYAFAFVWLRFVSPLFLSFPLF